VTGKPSNRDRAALLRQQLAASAGGKGRPVPTHDGLVPSITIRKDRITLPHVSIQHPGEPVLPLPHYQQGEPDDL